MGTLPGGPPRADVSEAAEFWPGRLQRLPPTVFCLKKKKKERKKVGEAKGQGDRTWGRNKGDQSGVGGEPRVGFSPQPVPRPSNSPAGPEDLEGQG